MSNSYNMFSKFNPINPINPLFQQLFSDSPESKKLGGNKSPKGYNTVSTFNPQQQSLFGQQAQGLQGIQPQILQYLQQLLSGSPESTKAFEAPYLRQFNEQTIPGIAERFAGAGALSSSGFQQALGQASSGLSEKLASLREGLRSGAANQGMKSIQDLLGINTQAILPEQLSFLQQMLTSGAHGFGQGLGMLPGMLL